MAEEHAAHYSLEAGDDEHRRLIALARAEAGHVLDACRRAGVRPGARAVDFGCGPLGAAGVLADVVGEQGLVIGVDASAAALERARGLVARDWVRFVEADVHDVTSALLGIQEADLVYSRLFLLHQRDPAATLRVAASLLARGGAVIAHEPSDQPSGAPAAEPPVPAMTRVWELVIAAARARGATTDFGRRGRSYLQAAGLEVESHRAYVVHYDAATGFEIPRIALHSLRRTLRDHDLASGEEILRLDLELRDAAAAGGVQWVSSPLMFEWIGRKPLA